MDKLEQMGQELCQVGKLLYDRGYVAANDGNLSVRLEGDRILITPSGVSKGRMTTEMLLVTDLEGHVLSGDRYPSSEIALHLEVYRRRSDVGAVVHAHPPVSTAFAVCRQGLTAPYLAELVVGLGEVPVTDGFAMLSTDQVPQSIVPFLPDHNAVLLCNHGAVTWGTDLWSAFDRMETVEHTAKILLHVRQLGGGVPLTEEEVAQLKGLDGFYRQRRGRRQKA